VLLHGVEHKRSHGADLRLHYAAAGDGPPVVLLHGFPDFWYGWRHQIPALAAAGRRVLAPDLRGYNESDRPRGVRHYRQHLLVQDVAEFIDQVAGGRADVVGHDWGGVIAWRLAARQPQRVRRLAILNAPHPRRFIRVLRRHPRQLLRSWYVLFNQLPLLPELLLRARDCAMLRRVLRYAEDGASLATESELDEYARVFSRPHALTAAINYYRAAARATLSGRWSDEERLSVPTLVIWGEKDRYLDRRLLERLDEHVLDLRTERLPHAGHFLHWQDPGSVNEALLAFLEEG
jgi:epoxide hydrolase 4